MPYEPVFRSAKPKYNPDLIQEPAATAPTPEWQRPQSPSKPLFFWKPAPARYGYLCQWYITATPMRDEHGQPFNCCEQYMMYHKAATFNDTDTMALILSEPHPANQKKLGKGVKNFDDEVWDKVKYAVVLKGNKFKFAQCDAADDDGWVYGGEGGKEGEERVSLRRLLSATGERELVEASRFDRVWGIGFKEEEAEAHREEWGENLLGRVLMETRAALRVDGAGDVDIAERET